MMNANTAEERQFFDAIGAGEIELVRALVAADPELLLAYDRQCFGATPITRVSWHGDRKMLEALVDLGADVNRRSDWKMGPWSPLHCAVIGRNDELATYLLNHGATLDVHTAAGLGWEKELTRLLDESPSRVNELGGDGCQPLHFADTPAVAKILLERGADIEARCLDHYSTPVQYLASQRREVARFLFSQGAKADIFSAILADDPLVVHRIIAEQPDALKMRIDKHHFPPGPHHDVDNILTFTVGCDATPMHAATQANLPAMITLLVEAGLSPNVRGGYDEAMPLHMASWNDHREAAEALLQHGAEIDARSGKIHNNSPAGWAIVAGSANVFELLLDSGASILDWFQADAQSALNGEFRKFKAVPQVNYTRIWNRLQASRSA